MPVSLYMDVHVPRAITLGLRLNGVDVVTAQEDDASTLPDPDLLDRASGLQRVLFTSDNDLLVEATRRQQNGVSFAGVIYAHILQVSIGTCVRDLETIAKVAEPRDLADRIEFLPL